MLVRVAWGVCALATSVLTASAARGQDADCAAAVTRQLIEVAEGTTRTQDDERALTVLRNLERLQQIARDLGRSSDLVKLDPLLSELSTTNSDEIVRTVRQKGLKIAFKVLVKQVLERLARQAGKTIAAAALAGHSYVTFAVGLVLDVGLNPIETAVEPTDLGRTDLTPEQIAGAIHQILVVERNDSNGEAMDAYLRTVVRVLTENN